MFGISFIGISYIIIYVGAIAVIFLFVIMMINIKLTDIVEVGTQFTKNIPLAIIIGSLFIYELYTIMPFTFNNISGISALLDLLNNLNHFLVSSNLFLNNVFSIFLKKNQIKSMFTLPFSFLNDNKLLCIFINNIKEFIRNHY